MTINLLFLFYLFEENNNPIHMAIHTGESVQKLLTSAPNKILFLVKTMHTVHHHIITFNINKIEVNNVV